MGVQNKLGIFVMIATGNQRENLVPLFLPTTFLTFRMASNLSMVIVGAGILVLLFASNISYKVILFLSK